MSDLEAVLDRLYELPSEAFVAARDAVAKELSGEQRAQVKALRKPTVTAALANRLVRAEPALLERLLDAGERLRAAQVEGSGELRAAVAAERAAVDALVKAAAGLEGATPTALDRLRATLHAAAGDGEVRSALAKGRLEREVEGGGAWPALAFEPASAPRKEKPQRSAADRERAAADREREAERRRLLEQAQQRRRERARAVEAAERDADKATRHLERAQAAVEDARERLVAAEHSEQDARAEAQRTLRALNEAQARHQEAVDDVRALEQ